MSAFHALSHYVRLTRVFLVLAVVAAVTASAVLGQQAGDLEHPFPKREKAPSFDAGMEWINTAGPIDLKQLRGRFVLLDFWTYCCINCMHILPELKKLEHAYPNEIVVIGVHSAKFATEGDTKNIQEAVLRYEIEHPVVNDAEHQIWQKFGVQSWPTLCVIDPEGNLVARNSGEIEFEALDAFFKKALPYYRRRDLLDTTPLRFELAAYKAPSTPLRFPGKILADEKSNRLFISDSNHNRIVITDLDGKLIDTIGSAQIGKADGSYDKASFDHPQGTALSGDLLYVADTENHLIRRVDLKRKQVTTIAGTGKQGRQWPGMNEFVQGLGARSVPFRFVGPPLKTAINSPWALVVEDGDLYIAMAGPHQIWRLSLGRPLEIGPFAGNGREDIVDGAHLPFQPYEPGYSSFAQPSGLSSDGSVLYVADSEGSSIRAVPFDTEKGVSTVVGTSWLPDGRLFTFGDVDGQGRAVRLQHALDVLYHEGLVYVADTYNNKVKVVDPAKGTCQTVSGSGKPGTGDSPAEFDEPAGLAYAKGKLYVADTNNHLIRAIDLKNNNRVATLEIRGLSPPKQPEPAAKPNLAGAAQIEMGTTKLKVVDGKVRLQLALDLPEGYKINQEAPLRYFVEAEAASGPIQRDSLGKFVDASEKAPTIEVQLPAGATGSDKLSVSLAFYYCQTGSEGVCKTGTVVWTVPLELAADATVETLKLPYKVKG